VKDVRYDTYMTEKLGPLPFCPGCGHQVLTRSLDRALVNLQLEPKKIVIVTDIGCIGLSDRYFTTNAFHGLHGRAVTYACGIKLARPELTVIALQGDGGCGIGGIHLLNVARRNIGITLIIGNNFNYGMTGGQHSVTTHTGGLTSTTPLGNVERPLDLCATARAAGAAWVYRAMAFDKDLPEVMARAIEQPGFSMLDVWELCTAYYSPRNKFKKKDLFRILEESGLELGLLEDNPRPEYTERYRQLYGQVPGEAKGQVRGGKKPGKKGTGTIEEKYPNAVTKQTGIVIAGSAGQKIQSTSTLFARAAMSCGLEATQKHDYPITVMTGHSISEVILSPERIDYTAIDSPDFVLVISEDGLKRARARIEALSPSCTVYVDASLELPATKARVVELDLTRAAEKGEKLSPAFLMIAAFLVDSGLFPLDAFGDAIETFQRPELVETSKKAIQAAQTILNSIDKPPSRQ
jgi:2-oxoglutarate ferredoxin oxidoreductase subunit beta